ncbi:MAG: hypothetical protein AB1352_01655 [Patescibacteria group bacterium]
MISTLPTCCQKIIRAYEALDFGQGRYVVCPYYNSGKRQRAAAAVDSGKGSPEEIIEEVRMRALQLRLDFGRLTAEEMRKFMIKENIGIDCSGLVAHALDPCVREKTGKSLGNVLARGVNSLKRKLLLRFRPFSNIDVSILTAPTQSAAVSLADIAPGDLIRTRGGKHVLLVEKTERNDANILTAFTFVHSTGRFFDLDSGFRREKIVITNPTADLADQEWQFIWQRRQPTQEGWREERERNGIFRLKVLM